MTFRKLTESNNNYEVNSKIPLGNRTIVECSTHDLEKAFLFSWNMTFGATGEYRSDRSGDQIICNNIQKFCDVFIGKLGEIDYDCYGLGKWDSSDFIINDQYHVATKTTKHFGNLLLLEEKDWIVRSGRAIYLPNQNSESNGMYDFLFFSRVKQIFMIS